LRAGGPRPGFCSETSLAALPFGASGALLVCWFFFSASLSLFSW
jgi:hypothetical protein